MHYDRIFLHLIVPKLLFIVLQVHRKVSMGSEAWLLVNDDNSCEYDHLHVSDSDSW